ncbi:MAG: DUF5668 domain-containing protein [Terracidiphilus sp.]|jgi:hypothetical protein
MSRYVMIRRLRFPAFLLLIGVIALLHQMGLIAHFWHLFWPLLLIMIGTFMIAERAALAAEGGYPPGVYPGPFCGSYPVGPPYPGVPYAGPVDPNAVAGTPQNPTPEPPATIPADSEEFGSDLNGGQS